MGGFLRQSEKPKCDDLPTEKLTPGGNVTDKIVSPTYDTFGIWKIKKQSCDARMDHGFTIEKGDDVYTRFKIQIYRVSQLLLVDCAFLVILAGER